MGACGCRDRPREAPPVDVEHRQGPQVDRRFRHDPVRELQQAHEVGSTMAENHAFRIACGTRRVIQGDGLPLIDRPQPFEFRVALGQQGFVVECAHRPGLRAQQIVDVDQDRRVVEQRDGFEREGSEFAVDEQQFRLAVTQDEGQAFDVKTRVDGIEHSARERNTEVRLQHRRRVGGHDGDGVMAANAAADQRRGQLVAARPCLGPSLAKLAMDDGCSTWIDVCRAIQKPQGSQWHVVGRRALQPVGIEGRAHDPVPGRSWV